MMLLVTGMCSFNNLPAQNNSATSLTDRKYWLGYMDKIASPVLTNLATNSLKENMPVVLSERVDNKTARTEAAYLEAFAKFSTSDLSTAQVVVGQGTAANLKVTATGTLTAVTTVTTLANGQTAHSSASTGSPLRTAGRVAPTTIATTDLTLVAGDASDVGVSTGQQLINKPNATAELDYNFVFSTTATTVTTSPIVQASGTASVRNYVKSIRVSSDALGAAGTAWILDGNLTVSAIAITTGLTTTSVAQDLKIGDVIVFTALAAGIGVTANTLYYVTSVGSTTTFNFALAPGGANVVPSVAYTGTTMNRIFDQIRFQTTAITPTLITYEEPLRSNPNMAINFLIPTTLTSGAIYLTVNGYRGF